MVPTIQESEREILTLIEHCRDNRDAGLMRAAATIGRGCSATFSALLSPSSIETEPASACEVRRQSQRADTKNRQHANLSLELKSLAHDLKNLGNSIAGYADLVADQIGDESVYLDRIVRNTHRLHQLSARFAAEVAGVSAAHAPIEISDVIGRVAEDRRPQLEAGGFTLHVETETKLITTAVPGDLDRIIDNFILNAAQAMSGQSGTREISIRAVA